MLCGDVVNAFMKKGVFTNSVNLDETPHNVASHYDLRYLPC